MKKLFCFTKKRAAAAIVATAAMLIVTGLAVQGEGMQAGLFALALLFSAAGGFFVLLDFSYGRAMSVVMALAAPAGAFCALENYTHVLTDFDASIVVLNLLFFYLLYGTAIFLTGSVKRGIQTATLVPMIFGLANRYVVDFRGTPIVPWDFFSLGTAVSVADNYSFTIKWKTAFVLIAFIWILLIASKSCVRLQRPVIRIPAAVLHVILLGVFVIAIQNSNVQSFFGMDTTLFTLNVLYRNNGIAGAFLGNLRFINIEEPEGYSAAAVEKLALAVEEDDSGADVQQKEQYPNIIVIMDEAFSDLSVWGDFGTSQEVMPFFKSLQEEAVGGELYVSVKGGNTANTEFEFLTGDSMAFLPAGSVPYQQYINDSLPSIASYLKSLGYSTSAIHPYNASGWDRDEVYPYMGFDEFLSREDFTNPLTMRGYISDQSAFEKIREVFEEKEAGSSAFIFEVTMQNHGGYSRSTPDFDSYIKLTGVENKTTSVLATEKYLTLMNQTDLALRQLVEYFDSVEEPVVLVMFGDHQPSDYITNVIQRICGVEPADTLEYMQQGYRVPFVIWSNFGLEHEYYNALSVNYMGSLVLEQAGLPRTGYQKFLNNLRQVLPVINANSYQDLKGNFYSYDDEAYGEELKGYQILQYNHLVDKTHRNNTFFCG